MLKLSLLLFFLFASFPVYAHGIEGLLLLVSAPAFLLSLLFDLFIIYLLISRKDANPERRKKLYFLLALPLFPLFFLLWSLLAGGLGYFKI